MPRFDSDSLWGSTTEDIIRVKKNKYDKQGADVARTLIFLWQRMGQKETSLTRMYGLFGHDKQVSVVNKLAVSVTNVSPVFLDGTSDQEQVLGVRGAARS